MPKHDSDGGVEETKGNGRGDDEAMMEVEEEEEEDIPVAKKRNRASAVGNGKQPQARRVRVSDEHEEPDEREEAELERRLSALRESSGKAGGDNEDGDMSEDDDEGDDEDDDDEEDEEEEEEVQQVLGENVRGKHRKQINKEGKPPEAGVLTRIYCENFMCHQKLSIDLGPHVNFITGQNGSGKSAILAALQVCLGARANVTHRGGRLCDLIRHGHDGPAVVRVSLMNKGSDAYRAQDFGEHITVERRIEQSGSSSYKLLAGNPYDPKRLRVVSNKREDLDRMLDLFNIQVENPCALLDQENAKKFIGGDGGEKYKFFMRAADLDRIMDSVREAMKRYNETRVKLEEEAKTLKQYKERARKLQQKVVEMEEVSRIEAELKVLKVDLVWSAYQEQKKKVDEYAKKLVAEEQELQQLTAELQALLAEVEGQAAEIDNFVSAQEQIKEQAEEARKTMMELRREITIAKQPLTQYEASIKNKTKEIKDLMKKKKDVQENIRAERSKLCKGVDEKEIIMLSNKVTQIEQELEAVTREVAETEKSRRELGPLKDHAADALRQTKDSATQIEYAQRKAQASLKELSSSADPLSMYGGQMKALVHAINRHKDKFREPPIGPLGMHIKLKDQHKHWGKAIENALAKVMSAFVTTSHSDRELLARLMRDTKCSTTIYNSKRSRRYSVPNDPPNILSVASCIQVEEDMVWNTLLNWANIGSTCIIDKTSDADRLVQKRVVNGQSIMSFAGGFRVAYDTQDYVTTVYKTSIGQRPFYRNPQSPRLGVDRAQVLTELEGQVAEHSRELQQCRREIANCEQRSMGIDRDIQALQKKEAGLLKRDRDLRAQKGRVQEELENAQRDRDMAAQVDLSDLEGEVQQLESYIKELQGQQAQIQQALAKKREELTPLEAREQNEIHRNESLKRELEQAETKLSRMHDERAKLSRSKADFERRIQAKQTKLSDMRDTLNHGREELQDERAKLELGTRNALGDAWDGQDRRPRLSYKDISKQMKNWEAKLAQERQNRNVGTDSIEVVRERMQAAKRTYSVKYYAIQRTALRNELIQKAVAKRRVKAKRFKKAIARVAVRKFDEVLQHKGQSGFLDFDHKEKDLSLIVQKDNRDEATQASNVKELSGGERSYSTLALLIALGESIESPFRVMDEFDVFLDAVSRKIAIDLLLGMAKNMEHRQFIFITPQDLSSVQPTDFVRVRRMQPPARSTNGMVQTTLG